MAGKTLGSAAFIRSINTLTRISSRCLRALTASEESGKLALEVPVHSSARHPPAILTVRVAHAMAMASDLVTADMIEAEFPQLANKWRTSVPMIKACVRGRAPSTSRG